MSIPCYQTKHKERSFRLNCNINNKEMDISKYLYFEILFFLIFDQLLKLNGGPSQVYLIVGLYVFDLVSKKDNLL